MTIIDMPAIQRLGRLWLDGVTMSRVQEIGTLRQVPFAPVSHSRPTVAWQAWKIVCRYASYLTLPAITAYFGPKLFLLYALCGLVDIRRNRPCNGSTLSRYFAGNGFGTW